MHWIIGGWHISVHGLGERWDWRVDDLVHGLDPIMLRGANLPDLSAALVKALDVVAAFEAINVIIEETRELQTMETPSWLLDPGTLIFDDDEPMEWLDLPDAPEP